MKTKHKEKDTKLHGSDRKAEEQSNKPIFCSKCGRTYTNYRAYKNHEAQEHSNKPKPSFVCSECHKVFAFKSNLLRHMGTQHIKKTKSIVKKHECGECNYSADRRNDLKKHWENRHNPNKSVNPPKRPTRPRSLKKTDDE
eukprot:Platyproteum_vivax@DN1309_c0_g1_i1.p1